MHITSVSAHQEISSEILNKIKETLTNISESNTHASKAYISHSLDDDHLFSSHNDTYIIGEDIESLSARASTIDHAAGIQIINMIVDSQVAYSNKIPKKISKYLWDQGYLKEKQKSQYSTLLQEALINAVEYGNLGLSGKKDEHVTPEKWFMEYRELVDNKLKKKTYRKKPIVLQCVLDEDMIKTHIHDNGRGFDYHTLKKTNKTKDQTAHGMGTSLIQNLADDVYYYNEGKSLCFSLYAGFYRHSHQTISQYTPKPTENKILIVDDQAANRELAKFYLNSAGYDNIIEAETGEQALQKAQETLPNLILLDVIMPDIDGFTVCRKLKQEEKTANIPILFLSGLTDIKNRTLGFRLGAVDYVNKPIDRNEMIARVDTHIRQGTMLNSLANYSNRIHLELENAKRTQLNLLPKEEETSLINKIYDIKVDFIFEACEELAGDYFNIFNTHNALLSDDETGMGIILADFTGHGVAASMNTVLLHGMLFEFDHLLTTPTTLVERLNDRLHQALRISDFTTLAYAFINPKELEMNYISQGAPPIAIIPKAGKSPYLLEGAGIPLGLIPTEDCSIELRTHQLSPGDTLIFYSDALVEAVHINGKMWEEKGLLSALKKAQKVKNPIEKIHKEFQKTVIHPIKDDFTLISVKLPD